MRILITAGGTSEPIDRVRAITNHSTGKLGAAIAAAFLQYPQAVIDYVTTKQAVNPVEDSRIRLHYIESTADLLATLQLLLEQTAYTAVIHSMAVSDFTTENSFSQEQFLALFTQQLTTAAVDSELSPAALEAALTAISSLPQVDKKISSDTERLILVLKKTPKVIQQIKQLQPATLLVGFKLLVGVDKDELLATAQAALKKNQADFVLANDLESITASHHTGYLLHKDGTIQEAATKQDIAQLIAAAIYNREEKQQ